MSSLKESSTFHQTRCFQLNLAEDNGLRDALRVCEVTYNADVLPRDTELMAPSDFYAAMCFGASRTRPRTGTERARLFPYLAA
ncbi:hypothetical protein SAMN05216330_108134 [Bradyrhizobium sp. Ghvi]|uniref:hypothetical protein n=1 Tax=Bradyrhizobium sp. Ghvi TaxID=1855319 RepID=UPI0008EA40D7|nr:hypothetical protein [Bradyrhizobium sp. Ghvi]SFP56036.1 hypothetical protein SAMN05216330_108134 [Bradyrhizobium sp. Ghvi]